MTNLSIYFSRALAQGRTANLLPTTRESLLATLLRKRAAAHNAGADELEALLRAQILWALPTRYGEEPEVVPEQKEAA